MNSEKRPIEIEDLLRLKRAERPPAEFWSQFDRQLRAKQLAAIVAKRPWWQRVPNLFGGFTRYHVPLGAAAVLAVTFITLRDNHPGARAHAEKVTAVQPASLNPAPGPAAAIGPLPEEPTFHTLERIAHPAGNPAPGTSPAADTGESRQTGQLAGMIPLVGAPSLASRQSDESAATEAVASLTQSLAAETSLTRGLLTSATAFETRGISRATVEPLQQIAVHADRARTRLQNAMVAMASAEGPTRVGERTASHLDEDRLSDQMRRLDARGDRVMWKF